MTMRCCDTCKFYAIDRDEEATGNCTFDIAPLAEEMKQLIKDRLPPALQLTLQLIGFSVLPTDGEKCPCWIPKSSID